MSACTYVALYSLIGCVLVCTEASVWLHDCAPPNTIRPAPYSANGTEIPALPTIPGSYQVRVEVNILNKNKTIVSREYFDKENMQSAIWLVNNNTEDYIIIKYDEMQLLYSSHGSCFAKNLTSAQLNFILYGVDDLAMSASTSQTPPHDYSTRQILEMAKRSGMTYMGRQVVRGIICDWWESCMYWPHLQSNFTLDYYFSVDGDWIEPDRSASVPVRAEIRGVRFDMEFGEVHFHHMYEYFDFRHSIWGFWGDRYTLFETPPGVICSDRKQTRKVPMLPAQYSYQEEIIVPKFSRIIQTDVYYDFAYKLVRFDYKPTSDQTPPCYTTNPVTEIHDYSTGIAYCMDRVMGNCKMTPIQNISMDSAVNVSVNANKTKEFYIRMKTPQQLFYLDSTSYTFEGLRMVRGILCDVFISRRSDFRLPDLPQFPSVFEFYFLSESQFEAPDGGNRTLTDVPIQLVISTPDWVGYQATYNIYNFDEEDPAFNRFDITPCFRSSDMIPFTITFPGTFDSSFEQYRRFFTDGTMEWVRRMCHVSQIRVQKINVAYDESNVYFSAVLVGMPADLTFFQKMPGKFNALTNDATVTATSALDCADKCNRQRVLRPCNSFDYCATNKLCSLSKTHADHGRLVKGTSNCDHYDRTVETLNLENHLPEAWRNLKNLVLQEGLVIVLTEPDGTRVVLRSNHLHTPPSPGSDTPSPQAAVVSQFTEQMNRTISIQDVTFKGGSVDECAQACLRQQSWVCNAFTYCLDIGFCALTKTHPDINPIMVKKNDYCSAFTKKYTVDYTKIAGRTILSNADTLYQMIHSAELCAQLCSNYDGFPCKSFDYCDYTSTCFLSTGHYYDIPKEDIKWVPGCDHYSRNYLTDFTKTGSQEFNNVANRIVTEVNVEQCAKLCVEQEAMDCAGFDYCGNTTTCRLTTDSMSNVGQVSFKTSFYCDIYSRDTFPDGSPYVQGLHSGDSTRPSGTSDDDNGGVSYSGGAMAGLAFVMLFLGVLIAGVIYIAYKRYKGGPAETDFQMHFVKEDSDT